MSTLATLATVRRSWDADAGAYLTAVESADQQQLEPAVAQAINQFVLGCKADGIWSAIKASCILMGARTLTGALTPLVGTAPTNNNFVSGDYARKTGLVGNTSTKYLNTNRAANADGQNDAHCGGYVSVAASNGGMLYGSGTTDLMQLQSITSSIRSRNVANTSVAATGLATATGYMGLSRSGQTAWIYRYNGTDTTGPTNNSGTAAAGNYFVFARNNGGPQFYCNVRLAFYSFGSNLTLATLDTRVSTLYTAIGAAIA